MVFAVSAQAAAQGKGRNGFWHDFLRRGVFGASLIEWNHLIQRGSTIYLPEHWVTASPDRRQIASPLFGANLFTIPSAYVSRLQRRDYLGVVAQG